MVRSIAFAMFAAALSLAVPSVHAAGLGRINVLSALGQPLLAEIEIVQLQAGEEEGLTARMPSVDAFVAAGIEPTPVLSSIRFAIQRRNNRPVVRVTSQQPVNEPFLELLVELQWSTGRLVREYTFLLDPVEYKSQQQASAAAAAAAGAAAAKAKPEPAPAAAEPKAAETKPEAPAPAVEAPKPEPKPEAAAAAAEAKPEAAQPEAKPEAGKTEPKIEAQPLPAAPPATAAAPSAPSAPLPQTMYEVKKGDTLGAIARQNLPPGATLNQMLIAIYRTNPDAFIRENVNLVRAGHILNIPDADAVSSVERADANRLVSAHIADFNEYRNRLAGAPAPAESAAGQRESSGRIEPKPAAAPPSGGQDQLKLSKADPQKPAAAGSRAAQGDDAVARERALKEAQSRVQDLEKNVADLQKLLELKNQQLAELEKKAGGKPAASAPAPAPAPAAKAPEPAKPAASAPAPAAKAPEPAKPAAPAPEPAKPAAPPAPPVVAKAPEAAKPAPTPEPAKPAAEPAKPAAPAPAAKAPEAKPAAKPPAQEPSLLDEFLDNPIALGGLGFVVLLLIGYGAWAWSRKKKAQARFQDSVLGATSGAASVFGTPSAAPVSAGPSASASISQPSGMDTEEVDPIAEADVYMAYGRDAQAEEILKEALQKDDKRTAVHVKLLEIYANRKDTQAFEQSAVKLKSLTNGAGPEWEKVAALGRSIDPQNGLYGGAGASTSSAAPAAASPALDFDLGGGGGGQAATPDISLDTPTQEPSAAGGSVDFDLGAATAAPATPATDFTPEGTLIMGAPAPDSTVSGLDFDLGSPKTEVPAAPAAAPAAPPPSDGGLDFDLKLDDLPGAKPEPSGGAADLSSISLDLGSPAEPSAPSAGSSDPKWQEVATKLDLAKAYEEMGDKDGARELLNEVVKDGDAAQKGQAEQLLAKLA